MARLIKRSLIPALGLLVIAALVVGIRGLPAQGGLMLAGVPVTALASPDDGETLYAGTRGDGLYASFNGGSSWSHASTGLDRMRDLDRFRVTDLVVAPGDPDPYALYLCTNQGHVHRSMDEGASWELTGYLRTSGAVFDLEVDPFGGGAVYAGTDDGLFGSTDEGLTWVQLDPLFRWPVLSVACSPHREGELVTALWNREGRDGGSVLRRSTDGGESWGEVSRTEWVVAGLVYDVVESSWLHGFRATRQGAAGSPLMVSEDGGVSWWPVDSELGAGESGWSLAYDPYSGRLILGTDLGAVEADGADLSPIASVASGVHTILPTADEVLYGTDDGIVVCGR